MRKRYSGDDIVRHRQICTQLEKLQYDSSFLERMPEDDFNELLHAMEAAVVLVQSEKQRRSQKQTIGGESNGFKFGLSRRNANKK